MLECITDSREQDLFHDLQNQLTIPTRTQMLPLGDIIIQKDDGEILLMIERKSVRDLVQSLKDGRHHDQRRRWLEFIENSPNSFVSLWVEGDLMTTMMDDTLKSSLLNSLFRLQSKHRIIVYCVRTRTDFINSLKMVVNKFEKDPHHLVPTPTGQPTTPNLNQYKKSAHSGEHYWQNCLSLVPGVSQQTAQKLTIQFPSLVCFVEELNNNPHTLFQNLSNLKINEKRRLGEKLAQKIIQHIHPTLLPLDQTKK